MTIKLVASIRRNQRQWMVVLTILAIFAFLFEDVARGASNLSSSASALFFAVLCGGLLSVIGYSRGHAVMYGLIGVIGGGGAALIGSTFAGARPVVRTNVGNLSRNQIVELQNRRIKVNRFLSAAMQNVSPDNPAPNFGDVSESSMVAYSVLQHEARRLGVSVSDEAVARYIQDAVRVPASERNPTEKKLTQKAYETALRETEISESELFNLIRDELAVQLVGRLLSPPANVHPWMGMWTNGQLTGRLPYQTPERLWEDFRKLNVKQSLSVAAIPVSEFEKQVAEPSESEVREYFEKRKSLMDDDRGNPGFLELPKVKVGYFEIPFSEKYEQGLPGATDQEIADYYLAHKEEYRVFDIPEGTAPKFPEDIDMVDPDAPADAATPENTTPVLNDTPELKPEPDANDTKDQADKKDPPEPKSEKKEQPAEKTDESSCDEPPADKAAADKAAAAKEPAGQEQPDKAPAKEPAAVAAGGELPKPAAQADDTTPPPPALPTDDEDVLPAPGTATTPTVRYRELNDELKLEIREKILLEKAFSRMDQVRFEAFQFLMELSLNYEGADKKDRAKLAATFPEKCKKYAEDHGLEYRETRELNHRELSDRNLDPIGSATEATGDERARRNARTVADLLFDIDPSARRISLYSPQSGNSPKARYAYWKLAEIPARVPDLKNDPNDPLRQRVVMEWKKEKARGLAEKRANELAELVRKSDGKFAAAVSGQTINGAPESPPVSVVETPKFTWLRVAQSVPSMGLGMPMESFIDGIIQPGPDFMKMIFEDLGDGDVGVGLNRPRDTFYVVRVHDRDTAADDGGVALQALHQQFLRETFTTSQAANAWTGMPTPYDYLGAMGVQLPLESRWRQNFNTRFGITFEANANADEMND